MLPGFLEVAAHVEVNAIVVPVPERVIDEQMLALNVGAFCGDELRELPERDEQPLFS